MGQIENFNSALSQFRAEFVAMLDEVKANQTPKEPDLSSQISQLQEMTSAATAIRATLASDATQSSGQTDPASTTGATTSAAGSPGA